MPETAFVKVLEALEIANPSIVTEALAPVTVWVNPSPLELTEKFAALPEELAVMASREPLASVTTFAVSPRLLLLIWLATAERVWVPSVVMVAEEPAPFVIVKLPAATVEELVA